MNIPGRKYFHDEAVYSDWFPRHGDDLIMRFEMIDQTTSSTLNLTFSIYTKNAEDTGDGTLVTGPSPSQNTATLSSSSSSIETVYVESGSGTADGLKEMVRVKAACSSGSAGDWILARIHPPIFVNRSFALGAGPTPP